MNHKMTIYARRLQIKNPSLFNQETLDAAAQATVRSCRNEVNAIVEGPCFDCSKASNSAEMTICATPQLSRIDVELNNAVTSAKIMTSHKESITNNLRNWVKERNECNSQVVCIQASYNRAINYIEGL